MDDEVGGHRLLAAKAADPVTAVLDCILEEALGANFVPHLGQVDEVMLHALAEHALQLGRVALGPLIEEGPVLVHEGQEFDLAGGVRADDERNSTRVEPT